MKQRTPYKTISVSMADEDINVLKVVQRYMKCSSGSDTIRRALRYYMEHGPMSTDGRVHKNGAAKVVGVQTEIV